MENFDNITNNLSDFVIDIGAIMIS